MANNDSTKRRAAMVLMQRGQITQAEAGKLAGVSRQAVAQWLAGIRTTRIRDEYLARLWARAIAVQSRIKI